jgi:multisubunit Na+/H+ antiporter MnhG subunit
MPNRIRLTALLANGAIVLAFGFLTLFALGTGQLALALFFLLVVMAAAFNIHIVRRAAHLLAEEEWLKAEVRKAELRQRLASIQAEDEPSTPPPLQLQGPRR